MGPEELYQKLDEIRELEEKFKGDPKARDNWVREYSHLLCSMPDLISYAELRDYHDYLIGELKKTEDEVRKGLSEEMKEELEGKKGELKAELEGLKGEYVGEFKRKLLGALKERISPEAYSFLESEIEGLLP